MPIGVRLTCLSMLLLSSLAVGSVLSDAAAAQNEAAKATDVTVPAVVGESAREARRMLAAAGLVARFQIGKAPTLPAEALRVYAAEPKPGTKLNRGSEVR